MAVGASTASIIRTDDSHILETSSLVGQDITMQSPFPDILSEDYPDFRAEISKNRFAVIKNAVPRERAIQYEAKAHAWLNSFEAGLDLDDPSTWLAENLPLANSIGSYAHYCVAHEKFVWEARQEPGVLDAFSKLWETDRLLVSFDSLNVTLPNRRDTPRREPWEHIDQSPLRRGVHCVQGIINLSPSGPEDGGLVVFPGSHKLNDEFFDAKSRTDKESWQPLKDVYLFGADELKWFASRGVVAHKVCAEPGDLIMWDSRTIHYGAEPTERSSQIRTVIYATYSPAALASPDQLKLKREAFQSYSGTSHWPHMYIVPRSNIPLFPDRTVDPRGRNEPLEKPELTDKLLKLGGMKDY
ncbi:hypothetical protein PFICI_11803 [Pestalotiopsis fici W106-1]|uniref:Phytanoyl-CoA dioxygenase n=1 Tax=Pestalotiopsis fici (strain W106-1 / CGMCC3.15140) TaxID=1229662 RepID=W3WU88_PESFW|nr:uncharacterized protein PFICI_11803 [Pestalotiopsis fici W106-1]ETS76416.1 hypothetical protein PFICI_11803 [Pestalotiopsis fici W106-1]